MAEIGGRNSISGKLASEKARVILYSRPGCHLCDEMMQELHNADCDELYLLEEVNIEGDPELLARYRYEIPVLLIDGVEAFNHRLSADTFRAYLEGSSG